METTTQDPAVPHLFLALFALLLLVLIPVLYQVLRFNKVACKVCGDRLRERDSIEHEGDPCAYTHPGICADKHAKVHVAMYYGDTH